MRMADGLAKGNWNFYKLVCVLLRRELADKSVFKMSASFKLKLLKQVSGALKKALDDSHTHKKTEFLAVWILRTLRHLALTSAQTAPSPLWKEIWNIVVSILPSLGIEAIVDEAFTLLAMLPSCGLLENPEIPYSVWDIRAFKVPGTYEETNVVRFSASLSAIIFSGQAIRYVASQSVSSFTIQYDHAIHRTCISPRYTRSNAEKDTKLRKKLVEWAAFSLFAWVCYSSH